MKRTSFHPIRLLLKMNQKFNSFFFFMTDVELLVNLKDLGPNVKEGDILEIYHPEEDERQSRLLLQVPHYEDINITKG